ncbi:hypothetical protein C8T65DRAFT_744432 [Cerioporus squamosus]|nr:hypothetical protein C8T65DRAFT_744432 [Cerioporus squamosus]
MNHSSNPDAGWEKGASGAHWRAQDDGKIVVFYPRKTATPGRIAQLRAIRARAVLDYYMQKSAKTRKVADAHSNQNESLAVSSSVERVASSATHGQKPDAHGSTSPPAAFPAQSTTAPSPSAHHQLMTYATNPHLTSAPDYSQAYQSQLLTASTAAPVRMQNNQSHSYHTQQSSIATAAPAQGYGQVYQTQQPSTSAPAPAQSHSHSYQTHPPSTSTAAPAQDYGQAYQTQQLPTSTAAPAQNYGHSYHGQPQLPSTTPAQYTSDARDGQSYHQQSSLPGQYANDLHSTHQPSSSVPAQYPANGGAVLSFQSPTSTNPADIPALYSDGSHGSDRQTYGEQYRFSTFANAVSVCGLPGEANGAVNGQQRGSSATSHIPGPVVSSDTAWTESAVPPFESSLANFDTLSQNSGFDSASQAMVQYVR